MPLADLPTPIAQRYFEDYPVGSVVEYDPIAVDEDEVVAFARRYDPQPLHLDPAQAATGLYGGLIASGWHTAALMMRVLVDRFLSPVAGLGSPGVDELRWLAPVRPGDLLRLRVSVLTARRSRSKPDRGLLHTRQEFFNQHGQCVMTMTAMILMACRSPTETA